MNLKLRRIAMLLCMLVIQISYSQSQKITVTGTVSDDSGPLPGVVVLVKNTSIGTQTDFDGNFSIEAEVGAILDISYVGMVSIQKTVQNSSPLQITMEEDTEALEEVVVVAFGKARQKKSLGYSTTAVTAKQLTEVPNTNMFESLSGKVAGMNITSPSQPGASPKLIIRGFSSLSGNSPLYIVDGSPINNSTNNRKTDADFERSFDAGNGISDIDPNNIESINVLKGAAAAALYGSRASNGAIIITTKRGKSGKKMQIDFSSSYDASVLATTPRLQNKFGQGWNGEWSSSLPSGGNGASNENGSWGAPFDGKTRVWGHIVDNSQQIKPYVALEDNIRDFYDTGYTFTNSLRLSGGSKKADYSVGFTDTRSDGIVPTDSDAFKRKTLNTNGGLTSKDERFKVRVSANYVERDQNVINTGQGDNAGQGEVLTQELLQIPRDISLVDLQDYINNPFNNNDNFYTPYSRNPYWTLNENKTNLTRNRFYGNINLSYQFLPNLVASLQVGTDVGNTAMKSYGAIIAYTPGSPNDELGATNNAGGVTESQNQRKEFDTFLTFDYDTKITEDLTLDLQVGGTFNERSSNYLEASITDLSVPNFYELSNTAGRPTIDQDNSLRRTYGAFGSGLFTYKNKLFLTLTARNDWSSTLPKNNNSYFYPSASLAGIALDNGDTFVKLRAALAKVAKDTSPYFTNNSLTPGINDAYFGDVKFPIGGQMAYELNNVIGNPDLKPEITTEFELGGEISLLNRMINIDLALYHKKSKDVIIDRQLARSTGFSLIRGNYLDLQNQGVELAINATPISNGNFKWVVNYTFTKNMNKVTDVVDGLDKIIINNAYAVNYYAEKGEPLGVFKTKVALTNDQGQIVVDANGIPRQSSEEKEIGNSQRDFIMGLQNSFQYKNLRLSFSLDYKQGGEMYSYTARLLGFTGNSIATTYNSRNPFIVPNSVVENTNGSYSENTTAIAYADVTGFYSSANNGSIEETHVVDKTFIRLQDISLAYSFPESITSKLKLNTMSLSLYGKNLFMWTPDDNPYIDPEVSTFGTDLTSEFGEFAGNPTQRTYGMALKLSL